MLQPSVKTMAEGFMDMDSLFHKELRDVGVKQSFATELREWPHDQRN
jgi:hypothetical protein